VPGQEKPARGGDGGEGGLLTMLLRTTLALTLLSRPAAAAPPATITAPLEVLKTKHIAVSVRVNGAGPFRLVLDTGSPISFLSGHAAEQAGLITADAARRPVLLGMRGQAVVKSLEIGGAQVKD